MKQLKILVLTLLLFTGASSYTTAQDKVAHINVAELVKAMPEYKEYDKEMKKLEETYMVTMQESAKEFESTRKRYAAEERSVSPDENKKRAGELQQMQEGMREYAMQSQKDIQQKDQTLMKPIAEKAKEAINAVAKQLGYNYVFDSAGLIVAEGKDLMTEVKAYLKI